MLPEFERVATGEQLERLLDRGYELGQPAGRHQRGTLELAEMAGNDRRTIEQAFRVVAARAQ